jgi:nucleotide-binding universal stress UspA family protein
MQLNKILLPIELPATTMRVVGQASALAHQFGSEILLLHVVKPMSYPAQLLAAAMADHSHLRPSELEGTVERQLRAELERALTDELAGVTLTRLLYRGDVASSIEQIAREQAVDLIMMGSHSHEVRYRWLLGSTTAQVLQRVDVPLWIDPYAEWTEAYRFSAQHLLAAIDLSAHGARTLATARRVAAALNAELSLVHVTASVEIQGPGGPVEVPRWRDELVGAARTELARLQREEGSDLPVLIESGNVAQALNRAARAANADLLIIGRRPSGGHLGDNGAGYALIREAAIPVLSVRPDVPTGAD